MHRFLKFAGVVMLALTVCLMVIPADAAAQCPGGICNLQPSPAFASSPMMIQATNFQAADVQPVRYVPVRYVPMRSGPVHSGPIVSTHFVSSPVMISPHAQHRSVGLTNGGRQAINSYCSQRPTVCQSSRFRPINGSYCHSLQPQRSFGISLHSTRIIR